MTRAPIPALSNRAATIIWRLSDDRPLGMLAMFGAITAPAETADPSVVPKSLASCPSPVGPAIDRIAACDNSSVGSVVGAPVRSVSFTRRRNGDVLTPRGTTSSGLNVMALNGPAPAVSSHRPSQPARVG
jgi:hypothetical protein